MDWDWKEFAWDPCELELGLEVQKNEAVAEAEASVDLRLGGEVSSDSVEKSTPDTPKDSKAMSSSPPSSGSSKRSRLQNGSQNFSCLVDGCNSDLSDCREYHRRHRVCEKHSKTPVVLVGGKQQRFCQQCSRFHSVGEFDEVKRSCRKRLDGHNRRRRKPQPSSLFMAAEKFMYNYKGPRILHFGGPQGYVNPIMRNMWPSTTKTEAESGYDHQRLLYRIESNKHKQDKGHPLWQENGPKTGICNESAPRTPISQPILGSIAPSTGGKRNRELSPDSKPGSFDSGCALYLLSNLQTQSSSELGLMQSSINCPTQSPSSGAVHFDATNTTNLHCNGMLQMGPDGLNMENEDSLTLPIFWE